MDKLSKRSFYDWKWESEDVSENDKVVNTSKGSAIGRHYNPVTDEPTNVAQLYQDAVWEQAKSASESMGLPFSPDANERERWSKSLWGEPRPLPDWTPYTVSNGITTLRETGTEAGRLSEAKGVSSGEAARHNEGKTPYAYLPLDLLDGAARVMAFGATKYGLNNFRKGYKDLKSPLNSLMRHVMDTQRAILLTEDKPEELELFLRDAESGESHLDHVITSAMLLKQAILVQTESRALKKRREEQ